MFVDLEPLEERLGKIEVYLSGLEVKIDSAALLLAAAALYPHMTDEATPVGRMDRAIEIACGLSARLPTTEPSYS